MSSNEKIVIVGGGASGLMLAAFLKSNNIDVVVVDKEILPADKYTTFTINNASMLEIENLGLKEKVLKFATESTKVRIVAPNGGEATCEYHTYNISKWHLEKILLNKLAQMGVKVLQGCQVLSLVIDGDAVTGVNVFYEGEKNQIKARLVVGADGRNSVVAKNIVEEPCDSVLVQDMRTYFENVILDPELTKKGYTEYHYDDKLNPMYLWVIPTNKGCYDKGFVNVGFKVLKNDGEYSQSTQDLEKLFEEWKERSTLGNQFARAKQVGEWKLSQYKQPKNKTLSLQDGVLLLNTPYNYEPSIIDDEFNMYVRNAKIASQAIAQCFAENDFSETAILENYTFIVNSLNQDHKKLLGIVKESMKDCEMISGMVKKMNERDDINRLFTSAIFGVVEPQNDIDAEN